MHADLPQWDLNTTSCSFDVGTMEATEYHCRDVSNMTLQKFAIVSFSHLFPHFPRILFASLPRLLHYQTSSYSQVNDVEPQGVSRFFDHSLLYCECFYISCCEKVDSTSPSCSCYTPYKYAGCFEDPSTPTTALIYRTDLPSGNMTVEVCTAFCKGIASSTMPFEHPADSNREWLSICWS